MDEQLVIEKCKEAVISRLKSPISAIFNTINILETDKYGRVLLEASVDAQNAFGAMIRNDFWVVITPTENTYKFTNDSVVKKGFIGTRDVAKGCNRWDKSLK